MKMSNYVMKVEIDGQYFYLESIHSKTLPIDSSVELFRQHFFLHGQEQESLKHFLLTKSYEYVRLTIIPGWECNLRCTHCCVLNRLVKKDEQELSVEKLRDFIDRYLKVFDVSRIDILFCGGEPLLKTETLNSVIDCVQSFNKGTICNITTNLFKELTEHDLEVLSKMSTIGISIDGAEAEHNNQRKSFDKSGNPYQQSLANIKKMILYGLREKIYIQSTVALSSREAIKEFHKNLLRLGVHKERIKVGMIHPSAHQNIATDAYIENMKRLSARQIWHIPCCKYQYMHQLLIDNKNQIFTDFYVMDHLGSLDDSIEHIANRYRESIFQEMPCLHDPVCIQCPVLGYCWGRCCQSNVSNKKPSELCDQDALIQLIHKRIKDLVII